MALLEDRLCREADRLSRPEIRGERARWAVLVRLGELSLKRGHLRLFMNTLRRNLEGALKGLPISHVAIRPHRCFVWLAELEAWPQAKERLRHVFGIVGYAPCLRVPPSIDAIQEASHLLMPQAPESFAVRVHRGDKTFPLTSQEVERLVGAYIKEWTGARVDLASPQVTYYVEIQPEGAFCTTEQVPGPGGLPVGTGGKVAALLSGGIDSPVASYRMMKRGCQVVFVHFTSYPFTDASSWDKCRALMGVLTPYQQYSKMYVVLFGEVQRRIVVVVPPQYRILMYRRMMVRIAQRIALREGCKALVTGESLGQVGSQTLDNIVAIEAVAQMPIFRPLIGMDKQEIIAQARAIGTYDISIEPDMDCCQFLVPPRVATASTPERLAQLEASLDVEGMVELALSTVHVEEFRWP
jgi:thiamine biosynthesis protein ThiI